MKIGDKWRDPITGQWLMLTADGPVPIDAPTIERTDAVEITRFPWPGEPGYVDPKTRVRENRPEDFRASPSVRVDV